MASNKGNKPKAPKRSSERRATRKARRSEGKKGGMLGKIKWGEAILFAALGYEMGNVLQATGLPRIPYGVNKTYTEMVDASGAATPGDAINKVIGAAAGAKVLYDGAKGKVTENDLSVMLPYTLGTVFDKNKAGSSGTFERW